MTTLLLLQISFALIVGLLVTRAIKYLHLNLPDVTAYLLTGLLIGPFILGSLGVEGLGLINTDEVNSLKIINQVALGFIAFSIGNEFKLSELKTIGKKATIIGIVQAVTASLIVSAVLIGVHYLTGGAFVSIPTAITLGAIAAATAPAATLMVVKQYKAKGKITDLLLPVVALDDAVGLVIFAVNFGIANALMTSEISVVSIAIEPVVEIVASLLLGFILGCILSLLEKMFFSNTNRVCLSIGFVILSTALSSVSFKVFGITIAFSDLLVNMMLGSTLCNMCDRSDDIMKRTDKWTAPLYALFFILSGAQLNLLVLEDYKMIIIGLIFIITRSIGKYVGAYISSKATGCDSTVCKYLGITLLPQAGVALGMCAKASSLGGNDASVITNTVLFAVMIYELIGPSLTRWSLYKAGEINEQHESTKDMKRFENAQ